MNFMTKEEFINESNIEIIQKLIKENNGYITTKQLENFGISRNYLSIMTKKKMIERVAKGIYIDATKIEDVYYVLSISTPKIIYSHMTALYFHNLSIKAPDNCFDITVTKKYNNPKLKKHNVFYVDDKYYDIGIIEIKTPQGNKVKVYDMEEKIEEKFVLDSPQKGLYLDRMVWKDMYNFSKDCVLLVLSDSEYIKNEYIYKK